ncbi:DUF1465 family protein [Aureimonas fodinaquatilis]|uniref:DUF1465 family protein n=2 Tax=Aureimonas fodinaquatilis TaxID=2565783 RepID=A0A5B0E4R9_9HYPH|nr:DUF1465 family protein [Aureimonas fodinaquatilis]
MTGFHDKGSDNGLVWLSERRARGQYFQNLFQEGMALVDEAATYLDGHGRYESRILGRSASMLYAAESMRLTTRLMQLASWLLLQRAAIHGEMSPEQVTREMAKVKLDDMGSASDSPSFGELPEQFCQLLNRTRNLETRLRRINAEIIEAPAMRKEPVRNAVAEQISLLHTAFSF